MQELKMSQNYILKPTIIKEITYVKDVISADSEVKYLKCDISKKLLFSYHMLLDGEKILHY